MSTIDFDEVRPSSRGGRESAACALLLSCNKRMKERGKQRYTLAFRISQALMRDARWVVGDYVRTKYDPQTRCGTIVRVAQGKGRRLTVVGGHSSARSQGKSVPARFTYAWSPEFCIPLFRPAVELESVTVEQEGIVFTIPEDLPLL